MTGGSSKNKTTSSSEPWKVAQPALKYGLDTALGYAQSGEGTAVYGGPRVAAQSGQTQSGLAGLTGIANDNMGGAGLSGQYQDVIDAGGYNTAQRDALSNTQKLANSQWSISPELQRIIDQTNADALSNVSLANSASGRYGSGSADSAIADSVSQNTNNLLYSDLSNWQARRDAANSNLFNMGQTGFGNLGTAYTGMQAPSQTLLGVGQQQDAYQQALIDANINKFDEQNNAKWNNLSRLSAITGGMGSLGGTQTQKSGGGSNALNLLGYGLTGAGLLGGFF